MMINDLWYKNGVIYCLSVGTFMDANGDGIGDFQGLMRRLDYLQGLGVTDDLADAVPAVARPDDGYDISDYYNVDPRYGTLGDFVEFTHACQQRGMRVIIDLVVNHTSDPACMVQRSTQRPGFAISRLVRLVRQEAAPMPTRAWCFPACRNRPGATTRKPRPGTSIASTISSPTSIPSNPHVQAEILKIMGFWIQLGVSGFRMDAVPFVIATKGAEGHASRSSSTTCCARSASSCSGARATRSSSPKRMCCPKPTWNISATTASACR